MTPENFGIEEIGTAKMMSKMFKGHKLNPRFLLGEIVISKRDGNIGVITQLTADISGTKYGVNWITPGGNNFEANISDTMLKIYAGRL